MANFELNTLKAIIKSEKAIALKNRNEEQRGILYSGDTLFAGNTEISLAIPSGILNVAGESFVIPHKAFPIIEALSGDEVTVNSDGKKITLVAGKSKSSIQTTKTESFNIPLKLENAPSFTVPADEFCKNVSSVLYSVNENIDNKPLTGVLVKADGSRICFAGCDGHRIAVAEMPGNAECELIVPKGTVTELLKLKPVGNITIISDGKSVSFKTEQGAELTSRLIEGKYVDFARMMVVGSTQTTIKRLEMLDALARVNACLSEDKKPLIMSFSEKGLNLSFKNNISSVEEVIEDVKVNEPLKIAFNPRFLTEALKEMNADEVKFSLTSPNSPALMEDNGLKALLLPVAINN